MKKSFQHARGLVAFICVALVVVGLLFKLGIGSPSAWGIDYIAAICPLGALEAMLGAKEIMLHPVILLVVMVVVIVFVGKAFCAWACPVPWLQRLFHPKKRASSHEQKAARELDGELDGDGELAGESRAPHVSQTSHASHAPLAPIGGERDGFKLDSRHAMLVGTLASAAIFGFPVFCLICPVGLTFATIVGIWQLIGFNEPSWALLIAPAILVLETTVLRKWCSHICPISALVSLVSNANYTLRPRVKSEACLRSSGTDCHTCVDICPEKLDPHSLHIPDCSKCGECIGACPAQAIKIKLFK